MGPSSHPSRTSEHRDVATERVLLARLPAATVAAALAGAAGNSLLWAVGDAVDRMTLGLGEVLMASTIGAVAGGVALALCGRWAKRPVRLFLIVSAVVVVLYAGGPVSAVYAPYMEGAELFNVTTLVATEAMHLVSAAATILILLRYAVDRPS